MYRYSPTLSSREIPTNVYVHIWLCLDAISVTLFIMFDYTFLYWTFSVTWHAQVTRCYGFLSVVSYVIRWNYYRTNIDNIQYVYKGGGIEIVNTNVPTSNIVNIFAKLARLDRIIHGDQVLTRTVLGQEFLIAGRNDPKMHFSVKSSFLHSVISSFLHANVTYNRYIIHVVRMTRQNFSKIAYLKICWYQPGIWRSRD